MSTLLQEIVTAVNTEIMPNLPMMSSERKRIEMRVTLSALEKMIKHIRQELLNESKQLKNERKQKRVARVNNIKNPQDNNADNIPVT
jgi:hypothetical protein